MDSTQSEREASEWLARRDSGRWSAADEAAFAEWRSRSTENQVAVIRLQAVWHQADRLQVLIAGRSPAEMPHPGAMRLCSLLDSGASASREDVMLRPNSTVPAGEKSEPGLAGVANGAAVKSGQRQRLAALAAALLLMLFGGMTSYMLIRHASYYHTTVGGLKSVSMPDGSRVTLNTSTAIRIALGPRERDIILEKGEAFFDVAHDRQRPFVVHAGDQRIIAVGTQFSVFREPQGSRVVVTEGKVRVEDATSGSPANATSVPAGSVAEAGDAGVLVRSMTIAETQAYLAWQRGYLVFHDTPLADAVAEFNRYNSKQLVIRDSSLKGIRVGGNLRATNVTAFTRVLEQGFPVRATDFGDEIVLTAR